MQSENIPNPTANTFEGEDVVPTDVAISTANLEDTLGQSESGGGIVEVPQSPEDRLKTLEASMATLMHSNNVLSTWCLRMEAVLKVMCERSNVDARSIMQQAQKEFEAGQHG